MAMLTQQLSCALLYPQKIWSAVDSMLSRAPMEPKLLDEGHLLPPFDGTGTLEGFDLFPLTRGSDLYRHQGASLQQR